MSHHARTPLRRLILVAALSLPLSLVAPIPLAPTASAAASPPGAAPLGTTAYPVPWGAAIVAPTGSDDGPGSATTPYRTISKAVKAVPEGGTVVVRAGTYRESVMIPRGKRVTIQSHPGEVVWLDGSAPVTGFVRTATTWAKDGWTSSFDSTDPTAGAEASYWRMTSPDYPAAPHPEQVFVDGVQQRQVLALEEVVPGTFFVDAPASLLHLGSDPTGHVVDASALDEALFVDGGDGTVVRGIGIRRYATSLLQYGTLKLFADGVTVENVVVRDNATEGVGVDGANVTLRHMTIIGNGQLGIGATESDGLVVKDSRIEHNNTEHFNNAPVAGGIKVTSSRFTTFRRLRVTDNNGNGIWLDASCFKSAILSSRIERNTGLGIHLEISGFLTVADNLVADNGSSGLKVAESNDVQVWNNTFVRNRQALDVIDGPRVSTDAAMPGHDPRIPLDPNVSWVVENVLVRNNVMANGQARTVSLFGVEDGGRARNGGEMVSADHNAYHRTSSASPRWLVNWANYRGTPSMLVFTGIAELQGRVGGERNGIEVSDTERDPFLVDEAGGDYRVAATSPGEGKGAPLTAEVAALIHRPAGGTPRIGRLSAR